jgi:hypothetical protein
VPRDLETEDIMGVVVDRKPLRGTRGVVRVHLSRLAQILLELTRESRERPMMKVKSLDDDSRAARELVGDTRHVDRSRERDGTPGEVDRVVARL